MKNLPWMAGACVLLMSACTPVVFESPQPENVPALKAFPAAFIGTYENDGDTLWVSSASYVYLDCEETLVDRDSLDGKTRLIRDGLFYDLTDNPDHGHNWSPSGDTAIAVKYCKSDTQALGKELILKQYEDQYFLSMRDEEHAGWSVALLERERNGRGKFTALIPDGESETELQVLHHVMKVDTVKNDDGGVNHYRVSPRPAQLMQYLDEGGFTKVYLSMKPVRN
ncbi:MAG: hypothetical protein SF053_21210 [Bacteroidia bacterium]|nr:hypothetical protein [Bacteroidia bacterium]